MVVKRMRKKPSKQEKKKETKDRHIENSKVREKSRHTHQQGECICILHVTKSDDFIRILESSWGRILKYTLKK